MFGIDFEVIHCVDIRVNRSQDRQYFDQYYWSANKVNFKQDQMPQTNLGSYRGKISVLRLLSTEARPLADIVTKLKHQALMLAQVMEGFQFGISHTNIIAKLNEPIFVLGSIGRPYEEVIEAFCPQLFMFGTQVSYGIELLQTAGETVLVQPDTHFLVIEH